MAFVTDYVPSLAGRLKSPAKAEIKSPSAPKYDHTDAAYDERRYEEMIRKPEGDKSLRGRF